MPLIFIGDLIKYKGERNDAFSYIHDIFPTICDFTNVAALATVSCNSLLPVINTNVKEVRDYTYHAYRQFQRAYRKRDYKLIEYVRAKDSTINEGLFEARSRRCWNEWN